MKAHYFNPGYEAAVEQGISNYTPPKMVRQLRKDLQTLPLYYAYPDDMVYISTPLPQELMCERLVVDSRQISEVLPWGWSPELMGIFPLVDLPYTLEEMRSLGSRCLSIALWHAVYRNAPDLFYYTPPKVVSLEDNIEQGEWVLKEDFSSSGRGIQFISASQNPNTIITRRLGQQPQKRLFIEPFYPITEEWGYEFWHTKEGEIGYLGRHRAITERGRYKGSWLDSCPMDDQRYIEALHSGLADLPLGSYEGVIGVDTALYRDNGMERFVPCLEVNVRPTMGYVAICLRRDWLTEGQGGRFMILTREDALLQSLVTPKPLYLSDCRKDLTTGLYPLTPLLNDTYFVACLELS